MKDIEIMTILKETLHILKSFLMADFTFRFISMNSFWPAGLFYLK